jgi:hypothetical protein
MHLSVEFVITPTDCIQLIYQSHARWSIVLRRIVALGILALCVRHLLTIGLEWEFTVYLLLAVLVGVPLVSMRLGMLYMVVRYRPVIHISIDDDSISTSWKSVSGSFRTYDQHIPWSSFIMFGSATELTNHFLLECGRGGVWIPKRAFSTDTERAVFRQFVSERMGDRCSSPSAAIDGVNRGTLTVGSFYCNVIAALKCVPPPASFFIIASSE